jgi:hypothetical protein
MLTEFWSRTSSTGALRRLKIDGKILIWAEMANIHTE